MQLTKHPDLFPEVVLHRSQPSNIHYYIHDKFATSIPPNFIKVTPKPAGGLGLRGDDERGRGQSLMQSGNQVWLGGIQHGRPAGVPFLLKLICQPTVGRHLFD